MLQVGSSGAAVQQWQAFLADKALFSGVVDGKFGPVTRAATVAFQLAHGLDQTGAVDAATQACAASLGFVESLHPLTQAGREALFGRFDYSTTPGSEAITVSPAWVAANIAHVQIPKHPNAYRTVSFNRKAAPRLQELFSAWLADGLLDRVLTFDGSYAPRFIRGSTTTLSAHAWGTAFDINAKWNSLGAEPAPIGSTGCVRELVAHANRLGFYWGGDFSGRCDGMHFELVRL